MKGKRVIAGFLAGLMFIVPIHVRAEEIAYDIYTFTDMNNLTVSVPANLPLSYSGGIFSGAGDVTVSGMNTSSSDYAVEVSIDSVDIDYINESDNSAIASGIVSFGTDGVESWSEDEISSSISKQISVEVTDFPEVEGIYSSVINYSIEVSETLKDDTYFTKTVDNSTMTCEITGLTDAGKTWVKSAVTNNARAVDVQDTTKAAGELKIPETLVVDGAKYTVTSIGDNAFKANTDITMVNMADSVTKLGYYVFGECSNLVTCQLSDNITDWGETDVSNESADGSTFWQCSKLETVNIPNGVSIIPRSCFGYCTALKSVEIPANNIVIGHQAFVASGLTSIELPEGTTFSGSTAYSTALGKQFKDCTSLKNVTIPESVTFMPYQVFYGCTSLDGVSLPNTITEIGFGAFGNCSSLTSFVVPDSCEKIHNIAFQQCSKLASFKMPIDCNVSDTSGGSSYYQFHKDYNLKHVTFTTGRTGKSIENNGSAYRRPHACGQTNGSVVVVLEEGITDIYNGFLNGCTSIGSITIPSTIANMTDAAFQGNTYAKDLYWNGSNPSYYYSTFKDYGTKVSNTTLHVGDGITNIASALTGSYHQYNSIWDDSYIKGFNYVDWGTSNITKLNSMQFYRCPIKEIDLSNITTIGSYSLAHTSLTTITIPENVTQIEGYALSWCGSLTDAYLECYDAVMTNTDRSIFHQSSPIVHIGDSYQSNGVATIQTEIIGNNNLYDSDIHYIDWGNFKPTTLPQMQYSRLYEIEIPESVAEINASTFYYSDELKIVHLTKGTTKIGASAFSTTGVDTVYYDGTESERYDILTIDSTNNSKLINATWIYNGEDVPEYKCYSWIYDTTAGTAICTGISEYGKTLGLTSLEIPEKTISNGVEYTVVGIDEYAFQGNTTIIEVTLPDTITSISDGAFENCTKLSSISLSSNLSSLGGWVFKNTGLTSVTLPDSLVSIGNECFRNSTKLSSVSFGTGLESIGDNAFNNTVITVVNASNTNLQSIGGYAFANNSKLTTVSLPDTAVFVGNAERTSGGYQFYKCTALTELTIPSANTVIVGSLCDSCSSLTSVTIPSGVSAIGKYALCVTKIETLDFPKSITHVYQGAFTGCSKLVTVNYDGTVVDKTNITIDSDNSPLTNATWNYAVASTLSLRVIEEIEILEEDGIEVIDADLLAGYPDLKVLILPKTIRGIEENAFVNNSLLETVKYAGSPSQWDAIEIAESGNENLFNAELICLEEDEIIEEEIVEEVEIITDYTISDGVCKIDETMLSELTDLETITIPVSVVEISANAFINNTKLVTVNYLGTEEEWSSIVISSEGNDNLFSANITFAESEDTENELIDSELVGDEIIEDELVDDELTNDDSETSESGDDTSEETTDESVSDETTDTILPDNSEEETTEESSDETIDEVVEETIEEPSLEIQEDTIPMETEEPSASSEDYVAPVKEETVEEESASSEDNTSEPEVTESTEEVSESSEETIE